MRKLLVYDLEKFAIHDGPGIRTIVFLKGCPLECLWCSNPESQGTSPEVLHVPVRCTSCGACVEVCPAGAIFRDEEGIVRQDGSKCTDCGDCIPVCNYYARRLVGKYWTTHELLHECLKDLAFYKKSNGGITVSGGEPASQFDALNEFLQKCKQYRLHTLMETCGYATWNHLDELSDHLDMVFYDVKHMDPAKHREGTGLPNDLILENARRLSAKGVPLAITVPLIPGYNDDRENLEKTARFAAELRSLERVRLLPYHRLGLDKYEGLGREYQLRHLSPQDKAYARELAGVFESKGLSVTVGF